MPTEKFWQDGTTENPDLVVEWGSPNPHSPVRVAIVGSQDWGTDDWSGLSRLIRTLRRARAALMRADGHPAANEAELERPSDCCEFHRTEGQPPVAVSPRE